MSNSEHEKIKSIIHDLTKSYIEDNPDHFINKLFKKYKCFPYPKKRDLLKVYNSMVANDEIKDDYEIRLMLTTKKLKNMSGISSITIFLHPYPNGQAFSCKFNCHYCPNQPGQPRSYLENEPGCLRATRNKHDTLDQFYDRAQTLENNGHIIDKIELLVLGGTLESYPPDYLEEFFRNVYYAANTYKTNRGRPKKSLEDEINENITTLCRIIGLTIETRPDQINPETLIKYRRWGVTRVQLGIQTIYDKILKKINRGCMHKHAIKAARLLKDSCFKYDAHFMPNLPDTTPEMDIDMFKYIFESQDLQPDQAKIYPTAVTPYTEIEKWHKEGKYKPYSENELLDVLLYVKENIPPYVRINRLPRDIPTEYIIDGYEHTNLRQILLDKMSKDGKYCKCIRCREISLHRRPLDDIKLIVRKYRASEGDEYFISYETKDERYIYGFLRLRLSKNAGAGIFKCLENHALIRELHVYGQLINSKNKNTSAVQHRGLGTKLVDKAVRISQENGFKNIAVISGTGVRGYYIEKLGFKLNEHGFLTKKITSNVNIYIGCILVIIIAIIAKLFLD